MPALALVLRAKEIVASGIEHLRIVGRKHERRGPLETIFCIFGSPAKRGLRPDGNVVHLAAAMVIAGQQSLVAASINDIGIVGPHRDIAALTAANVVAIGLGDASQRRATRQADSGIVLLSAVDAIGNLGVSGDVIKLDGRLIILNGPVSTTVEGDAGAAIVAQ